MFTRRHSLVPEELLCSIRQCAVCRLRHPASCHDSLTRRQHAETTPTVEDVTDALNAASSANREAAAEARQFRRLLNKQETYTRRVAKDPEALDKVEEDGVGYSRTGLVAQVRVLLVRSV